MYLSVKVLLQRFYIYLSMHCIACYGSTYHNCTVILLYVIKVPMKQLVECYLCRHRYVSPVKTDRTRDKLVAD